MDEPGGRYAERNEPVTKGQLWHDSTFIRFLDLSESWRWTVEQWLPGAEGSGVGSWCLAGIEFQFYKMKRVMGVDGGDGCPSM